MLYAQQMIQSLQNGEIQEAQKHYKKVKSLGTDDEKFYLAEELFHLGFLDETKELYESLLEKFPSEGELIVQYAEVLVEMDLEEDAIETLSKIGESDPEFPRALLLQADLYQMQGLYEVSEQKLLKAKKLLPTETVIDFALAELYMELGRFLEAIRSYTSVLEDGQKNMAGVSIYHRLAEAHSAGGAFEKALEFYEKAEEEHLEINTLFGYGFTAFQAGHYLTAIEKLKSVKELDSDYTSVYLLLAKAYEREEMLKESLHTVLEGIKYDEYNKELSFYGGKIALKLNDETQAESLIRAAIALDPAYLEAALTLNKLLFTQERFQDVLEITEILNNEIEEDPQLIWDTAKAYMGLEKYDQSLKQYRLAYNFFKTNETFLDEYGNFLTEEGLREEAIQVFERLLDMNPADDELLLRIERLKE